MIYAKISNFLFSFWAYYMWNSTQSLSKLELTWGPESWSQSVQVKLGSVGAPREPNRPEPNRLEPYCWRPIYQIGTLYLTKLGLIVVSLLDICRIIIKCGWSLNVCMQDLSLSLHAFWPSHLPNNFLFPSLFLQALPFFLHVVFARICVCAAKLIRGKASCWVTFCKK